MIAKRKIQVLNNIAAVGLAELPDDLYEITDSPAADAILLRSANLHAITIADSVLAIGRAGAGTNNIPVD
ncbi:MAG: 3-phosphoglycerate dehydrogenase, partial [Burkholderiaceae bacterium]